MQQLQYTELENAVQLTVALEACLALAELRTVMGGRILGFAPPGCRLSI